MGQVEGEALLFEQPPGIVGLLEAFFGEIDIGPAGEPVFFVPDAFAVAQQYDFFNGNM